MSLEEILKDIELRGDREIKELALYYDKRLSDLEVKQAAQLKAQSDRITKVTEEEKRSTERTIISSAEMEALTRVRSREGALLQEALGKAEIYLKGLPARKEYGEILNSMVEIAKRTLGQDCTIMVSEKDSGLISAGKAKIRKQAVDSIGGIKAETADGSRELDLSITAIIQEIREKLISQFYEHLGE